MKTTPCLGITLLALVLVASSYTLAADDASADRPHVGELRSLAIAPSNLKGVAQLHHDGWLEARGQLLSTSAYPELFEVVGRTWTRSEVKEGRFAIPEIRDQSQRRLSSDNPFGVLGPGDLVTSGRVQKAWLRQAPLSHWIFVGREVKEVETIAATHR
jgi:hypothetical protein